MGLNFGLSRSRADNYFIRSTSVNEDAAKMRQMLQNTGNPDPYNLHVIKHEHIGKNLVIKACYPNCTNYEGMKILVFTNITLGQLMRQGFIDPHFSKSRKYKHPFARFVPTERGWMAACYLAGSGMI